MTRIRVHDKSLIFTSEIARAQFFERAEGRDVLLTIDERPSAEIRGYFEGCVVPVFFYSHPESGWTTFAEAREVLKLQFLPSRTVKRLDGSTFIATTSLSNVPNEHFKAFVEAIVVWMTTEDGVAPILVDSEAYKRWRDTQVTETIYPPLARLKNDYERKVS